MVQINFSGLEIVAGLISGVYSICLTKSTAKLFNFTQNYTFLSFIEGSDLYYVM